jgi:hypothetical protein
VASIDLATFPLLPVSPTDYDPDSIRNHMDSFVLVLAEHLHHEIDSLSPEKIEKVGKKEDEQIRSDVLVHLKKYDPGWFLCAAMSGSTGPAVFIMVQYHVPLRLGYLGYPSCPTR